MINNQKHHRLMKEYQETGNVTVSAMRADVSRPTARKYIKEGKTPSELQAKHTWRTRRDPLDEVWDEAMAMLEDASDLEAKTLFEHLRAKHPSKIQPVHLRTFQRRVKQWRLQHGPDKEVFFPQNWKPGRAMQLDWTNADELGVRINGSLYDHLLCHVVLPYSNWGWATRCRSESLLSLRHGLQEGAHRLGRVPEELRVDNSTAATHRVGSDRDFNVEFLSICEHYGMKPRTIGINCPNENGDVESANGHLKRRLNQHLILRTSRDFLTEGDYQAFLEKVLQDGNKPRQSQLNEELQVMKPLPPTRLAEYDEVYCPVSSASTIRVKKVGYSVPARLIGAEVKVEVYESELKVYSGRELLLTLKRECGDRGVVLDYRHVIDHLLRKPGAFEGYRYREELFPSRLYREAYDRLIKDHGPRKGTLEYLRLLKLSTEVEGNDLELMLVEFVCPPHPSWTVDDLRNIVLPRSARIVQMEELTPEWGSYDQLIKQTGEVENVG
jgi:transposase